MAPARDSECRLDTSASAALMFSDPLAPLIVLCDYLLIGTRLAAGKANGDGPSGHRLRRQGQVSAPRTSYALDEVFGLERIVRSK